MEGKEKQQPNALAQSPVRLPAVAQDVSEILRQTGIVRQLRHNVHRIGAHAGTVYSVYLSNDGARLATGGDDAVVRLWDVTSGCCLMTYEGHCRGVTQAFLTSQCERLLTLDRDGVLKLWEVSNGRCLATYPIRAYAWASVSADGHRLTARLRDGTSMLLNVQTGKILFKQDAGPERRWRPFAISLDGKRVATVSQDGRAEVYDVDAGTCLMRCGGSDRQITHASLSPDGTLLVTSSLRGPVELWGVDDGTCRRHFGRQRREAAHYQQLHVTANGNRMVTIHSEAGVRLWDLKSGRCLKTTRPEQMNSLGPSFSDDGRLAVSGSPSVSSPKVWNLPTGECVWECPGQPEGTSAVLTATGDRLVTGHRDGTVMLWDVLTNECLKVFSMALSAVTCVCISSNAQSLVAGGRDGRASIWETRKGRSRILECCSEGAFSWLCISADGKRLATVNKERRSVRVWDIDTEACLCTSARGFANQLSFNCDGSLLLTGYGDRRAVLSDSTSGRSLAVYPGTGPDLNAGDHVSAVCLSMDGTYAVIARHDDCVRVYHTRTGRCLSELRTGHASSYTSGAIYGLLLTADNRYVVTGCKGNVYVWELRTGCRVSHLWTTHHALYSVAYDNHTGRLLTFGTKALRGGREGHRIAQLWDLHEGRCVTAYGDGGWDVTGIAMSANGRFATGCSDGVVRLWDTMSTELVATFYSLERGFLWTIPPDDKAPCGWFWTDREELIHVVECSEDGGNPRPLARDDPRRREYMSVFNRRDMVMARLNDPAEYQRLVGPMRPLLPNHQESRLRLLPRPGGGEYQEAAG
jgi:WD40 repeat protein